MFFTAISYFETLLRNIGVAIGLSFLKTVDSRRSHLFRRRLGREHVPDPLDGDNVLWSLRVFFKLGPEMLDVDIDGPAPPVDRPVRPEGAADGLPAERLSGVGEQQFQKIEFLFCQGEGPGADPDLPAVRVEADSPGFHNLL
jgi:hypothetical protein